MKLGQLILGAVLGLLLGFFLGALVGGVVAREKARAVLLSGPSSDNYPPALAAIAEAKSKIQSGDTNVLEHLNDAQRQIEQAQKWSERFCGLPKD